MRVKWNVMRWLLVLLAVVTMGCRSAAALPAFDAAAAYAHVVAQCDLGFRYPGSDAGWATGDYIQAELEKQGVAVTTQVFEYAPDAQTTPVRLRNVIGKITPARAGDASVVILGAHYDTRRYADGDHDPRARATPVLGANDGGSGVAVLLELARVLDRDRLQNEVWLAFFDAEDQGRIDGWPWSVGASYMARHLEVRPDYVIIVDMVGDQQQEIYWEHNSDAALQAHLWQIAADLGYDSFFIPRVKHSIMDDHIPFVQQGVAAVDIIDLDYPYWHTTQDTPAKVELESLRRVGHVLQTLLEERPFSAR